VKHNVYRFTIKALVPEDIPAQEVVKDHVQTACQNMAQDVIDISDITIGKIGRHTWIVQLIILVKDYGVPQVGVDIVAVWIGELFRHLDSFLIDAMIVHPKKDGKGALIRWDYDHNVPIVKVIQPQ
jgi:hypothetical protein